MRRHAMVIVRWTFCLFLVTAGCAHLPVTGTLPEGARLTEVARVATGGPFALDPQGERLAFGADGLTVKDLATGVERHVGSPAPTALAWAPGGARLAASFPRGEESILRLYDRQGGLQEEVPLAGVVTSLAWRSPTEILAFAVHRQTFRFGGEMAEILYRWDGTGKPTATPLADTTLMPATLRKWGKVLDRPLTFALSPLGDEILYPRLHDPPAFTPYLRLVVRDLESGAEREVAEVSLHSGGAVFSGDGERVLFGDGVGESRLFDPWRKRQYVSLPVPGRTIALSPSGRYLLIDGHLYRDGRETTTFPSASAGAFSAGGKLVVRYGERLYLVAGLPEAPPVPASTATVLQLRQLRKWLSEGLITDEEYQRARERMPQ